MEAINKDAVLLRAEKIEFKNPEHVIDLELEKAIVNARDALLALQHEDGYWIGLLEADVTVVTDFIPLMRIFGIEDESREKKAIKYALERQNEDGSWSLFYKGSGSLDVTIRTYLGLKICGISPGCCPPSIGNIC